MALINCPKCQKEIPDKVKVCPQCGYSLVSESNNENTQKVKETDVKNSSRNIKLIILAIVILIIIQMIRKILFS
jgi:uncharacterized membrane protein YvbJ